MCLSEGGTRQEDTNNSVMDVKQPACRTSINDFQDTPVRLFLYLHTRPLLSFMQSDRNTKSTPIRTSELSSDPASSPLRFTDTGTSPQDNARINSFGLRGSSVSPIAPHFPSSVHSHQSDLHLSTTPVVHRSTMAAVTGGGGGPFESFSTYRPLFPDMSMLRADSREDRLRLLRSDAQQMNLTKAAIFYAEKIMTLTGKSIIETSIKKMY